VLKAAGSFAMSELRMVFSCWPPDWLLSSVITVVTAGPPAQRMHWSFSSSSSYPNMLR
jgi:ABC-type proline/glycine betaine transport system substrate-binding protein